MSLPYACSAQHTQAVRGLQYVAVSSEMWAADVYGTERFASESVFQTLSSELDEDERCVPWH